MNCTSWQLCREEEIPNAGLRGFLGLVWVFLGRWVPCPYHRTLLQVWVAPSGDPATMGTWMGLCCLFITRSSFSSRDLQVASSASSLASMLSSLRHMVWLMEYRNDWGGRRARTEHSEFIATPEEARHKRAWEPILKELAACLVTKSTPDDIQERFSRLRFFQIFTREPKAAQPKPFSPKHFVRMISSTAKSFLMTCQSLPVHMWKQKKGL